MKRRENRPSSPMMPNFLIIGAPKAGTTAIYHFLKQHPQVFMASVKEPHFFAFENQDFRFSGPRDQELLYHSMVTNLSSYRSLFYNSGDAIAIGEASAMYLYYRRSIERIRYHIPYVKLVVILRDPAERAFSSFLHLVRDNREPILDFAKALEAEETRIRQNWWPIWFYRTLGMYHTQLQFYLKAFDRAQIRVLLYEDFLRNPAELLRELFRFLEVDDSYMPDVTVRHNVTGLPKSRRLHSLYLFLNMQHPAKSLFRPFLPLSLRRSIYYSLKNYLKNVNLERPSLKPENRQSLIMSLRDDILLLQDMIERDLSSWLAL